MIRHLILIFTFFISFVSAVLAAPTKPDRLASVRTTAKVHLACEGTANSWVSSVSGKFVCLMGVNAFGLAGFVKERHSHRSQYSQASLPLFSFSFSF
jgi:hypothetical protein